MVDRVVHVHVIANYLYDIEGELPKPDKLSGEYPVEVIEKVLHVFKKYGTRLCENHYILTLSTGEAVELFIEPDGLVFLYHIEEPKTLHDIDDLFREIEATELAYKIRKRISEEV